MKQKSRTKRWTEAASKAVDAISELIDIQSEYQDWLDNLPENLQQSALGEKLEQITQVDLEGAQQAIEEAESADLPLGFGRD